MSNWTANDIPDQSGRTAIVTGANSGLGFVTSLELARHGAHVIMTARDPAKGRAALDRILATRPRGSAELRQPIASARDRGVASRLWQLSEELTGVRLS